MIKGLVSVLTPCYNTASYIHRLLDSILSQTYPFIEMIVIDDGSTDDSVGIVKQYIPKYEKRGYSLLCVRQENSGQSVAINNGLKRIKGEFLVWPDSDDYYISNEAIAKMVYRLINNPSEFAMVRTQEQLVEDGSFKVIRIAGLNAKEEESKSLFEDCLFGTNDYYFCPGAYMVRTIALQETTDMSIYTSKDAGQNWQLMLPILYSFRCLTIKEVLYAVVERKVSHSRGQYQGYEKGLHKISVYEKTILSTLDNIKSMPDIQRLNFKMRINNAYKMNRLYFHFINNQRNNFLEEYDSCEKLSGVDLLKMRWLYLFAYTNLIRYRFFRKVAVFLSIRF